MNRKLRIGLKLLAWIFLLAWIVYGISYAHRHYKTKRCTELEVVVLDSAKYGFVRASQVKKLILNSKISPIGKPINMVNTLDIEREVAKLAAVRDVQAFKSATGKLKVEIFQRRPLLRVFNEKGQTYYIDDSGKILPFLPGFSADVLVASGNIREPFRVAPNIDITSYSDSLESGGKPLIYELFEFARYVSKDKFWNAQLVQIYVKGPRNIELVPLVGPHVVQLGGFDGYVNKLKKLKIFYEKALPAEGWNKYSVINLKFSNQIVCTKY